MSNTNSIKNYTIAMDSNGKVLVCTESSALEAQFFVTFAREASIIIIGDNVTTSSTAFLNYDKKPTVYAYNENAARSVALGVNDTDNINEKYYWNKWKNEDNNFEYSYIKINNNDNLFFKLFNQHNGDSNLYNISDFGAKGDGVSYDNASINLAILYTVNKGGKLLFNKGDKYAILRSIKICPPEKNEYANAEVRNFDIDFNGCEIIIKRDSNGIPIFYTYNDDKYNSMIYVEAGYANIERMGIVQNVKLNSGYYTTDSGEIASAVENGMYLGASSQISYKNIEIKDVTRGVYIEEKHSVEVFMDDIRILKSNINGVSELDLSSAKAKEFRDAKYPEKTNVNKGKIECKHVGIDCRTTDCHFSNIVVQDYLIGMRILGGNNRIRNARVSNEHSPNQRKYSVGYINGSENYYINCKVNNEECTEKEFYIGWMSYYAVPFFLTNCKWYGSDIASDTSEKAYAFYIDPDNYSGGGIYTSDCSIIGLASDTQENGLVFCNVTNNDINYLGTTENIET